jgi:hypothetical protein
MKRALRAGAPRENGVDPLDEAADLGHEAAQELLGAGLGDVALGVIRRGVSWMYASARGESAS